MQNNEAIHEKKLILQSDEWNKAYTGNHFFLGNAKYSRFFHNF